MFDSRLLSIYHVEYAENIKEANVRWLRHLAGDPERGERRSRTRAIGTFVISHHHIFSN